MASSTLPEIFQRPILSEPTETLELISLEILLFIKRNYMHIGIGLNSLDQVFD
jgi:hypothetical protein